MLAKHLNGDFPCLFAVCCDTTPPKFVGLGLNPDGQTQEEIQEELRLRFNEEPMDGHILPPELSQHQLSHHPSSERSTREAMRNFIYSPEEFQRNRGGDIAMLWHICFDRIEKLVNTPHKKVGFLYRNWVESFISCAQWVGYKEPDIPK